MYLLELTDVTKNFATRLALDSASFAVKEGTIFGLLGPNGAGKTTLIRIITNITAADSGRVKFAEGFGQGDHGSNIGYLPEERGLYKKMKVYDQGIYFARLHGMSKKEAMQELDLWFDKFEINNWKSKKIEELSKGMAQKVQFIFTVLHKPRLLILDEPFTGFDPVNAALIKSEIIELKNKGTTIILSTHRMESVEELCDAIAFINDGKIKLTGEIAEIKNKYREHKIELVTNRQEINLPPELKPLEATLQKDGSYRHIVKIPQDMKVADALRLSLAQNEVIAFRELLPEMNEIFIQLAQKPTYELN